VIEEEFGVEIDMDVVPELVSFDRIRQYLQKAAR
jgi:acyl carrier protein